MKQIILDVETQKAFTQVNRSDPRQLGVSFVGIIEREKPFISGKEMRFFEADLDNLWPLLETADVLIGFNILGFDLPVLSPHYSGDINQFPTLDLLDRIKDKAGHRVSLNAVATETLGMQKSGSGWDALEYYQQGELDKLADYCMDDVRLTRDLYDFGLKNKLVKFKNKWNRLIELPVDFEFQTQNNSGVQMTLT